MHSITRASEARRHLPDTYRGHSHGYGFTPLVGPASGAVHTGLGLGHLDPEGRVDGHLHRYEEAFFVLEGGVVLTIEGNAHRLAAGHHGVIPTGAAHGWHAAAGEAARWLEVQAPQPRQPDGGRDTLFVAASGPAPEVAEPDLRDLRTRDHPFEETYCLLAGSADCELEGVRYHVEAGDVVFAGVGASHGFFNTGSVPVRWLETRLPSRPRSKPFASPRTGPTWANGSETAEAPARACRPPESNPREAETPPGDSPPPDHGGRRVGGSPRMEMAGRARWPPNTVEVFIDLWRPRTEAP